MLDFQEQNSLPLKKTNFPNYHKISGNLNISEENTTWKDSKVLHFQTRHQKRGKTDTRFQAFPKPPLSRKTDRGVQGSDYGLAVGPNEKYRAILY